MTVSLAMVAGVLAQALAVHLRVPGIIVLLAAGVILGPDVGNIVRPHILGGGLQTFVGFAVAIILFEGGLHMDLKRLRRQAVPIRRLVTWGAIITAIGAALAVKMTMGWNWRLSILFGTLVIVTGPTVITPLLRKFKIRRDTAMILEAEGIFIDAVGATIAVVALEAALVGTTKSAAVGVFDVALRIGVGAAVGVGGGAFLALLLRWRHVIPEGLENILSLAVALATFQVANSIIHESGITAAIAAGMVISNTHSHAFDEIVEFKEQLTSFFIATLFVLLAADVRVESVIDVGWGGVWAVALLMFVVRPITVFASTRGTGLSVRQQLFLSWLAPRGIVAAAVASLFAVDLAAEGIEGGVEMRALVFAVIAATVTIQGLTGGFVAGWLGLRRKSNNGYLILGANPLARRMAKALESRGQSVVLIDSNEDSCAAAKKEGLTALWGNGLEYKMLVRGQAESRRACISLTANESINFLFAKRVREHFRGTPVVVGLETAGSGVTAKMVEQLPAHLLFCDERPLSLWFRLSEGDSIKEEEWELAFPGSKSSFAGAPGNAMLPLVGQRGDRAFVVQSGEKLQKGDRISILFRESQRKAAFDWLRDSGFVPADTTKDELAS